MELYQALVVLKNSEFRYTHNREKILEFLANGCENCSSKELLSRMQKTYQSLTLSVIERNLQVFKQLNIVEVVEEDRGAYYRLSKEHESSAV
ncbi:MAG TPA: transcriptional repressor [Bacillota bacterium]|nr:transcriptional repressor [Bacillota bacterium]